MLKDIHSPGGHVIKEIHLLGGNVLKDQNLLSTSATFSHTLKHHNYCTRQQESLALKENY